MILKYLNTRFFISKYFATPGCLNSIVHIFIQKKPHNFCEICNVNQLQEQIEKKLFIDVLTQNYCVTKGIGYICISYYLI